MKKYIYLSIFFLLIGLFITTAQAKPSGWEFDEAHSRIYFDIRHTFAMVRGQFDDFSGNIVIDPVNNAVVQCDMEIRVESINTGIQKRDNHLRSKDFFDVEQYPLMKFLSREVKHIGGNRYEIIGYLTIKDVTQKIIVPFTFLGIRDNPLDPNQRVAGYEGKFTIDRLAFHVGTGQFSDMGAVGKDVDIIVTFEVLNNN